MAGVSVGSNPGQGATGRLDALVTLLYVSLMIPNEDETVDCMGLSFSIGCPICHVVVCYT